MTLTRRAAWFLVGFAAWNAFVWVTFVRNVFPDHHWDSFFLIHLGIGGVTTAGGLVVGWLGLRALRAARGGGGSAVRRAGSAAQLASTAADPAGRNPTQSPGLS